jgi:UDPglucose 6-dehydrogenase
MKLTVIGTSNVGLITGACLANGGNDVLWVDTDAAKVKRLSDGEVPIYAALAVIGGRRHGFTN